MKDFNQALEQLVILLDQVIANQKRVTKSFEGICGVLEDNMNNDTHSRFDFDHYKNCQPCYDDHLDFEEEQRMDALLDAQESKDE